MCYHRNDDTIFIGIGAVNRAYVFFVTHTHTHNQAKSKKGGGPHDKNHMNDNPSVGISTNIILIVIL